MDRNVDFKTFLQFHKDQLEKLGIPDIYWKVIHEKISGEVYDAGGCFSMAKDENGSWHVMISKEKGLKTSDPNGIFLVDHAWTFEAEYAKRQLQSAPNLLIRVASLTESLDDDNNDDLMVGEVVEKVMEKIWLYCQSYKIAKTVFKEDGSVEVDKDVSNTVTLWYMLDEFGSRFSHSDQPNMAFKMFFYVPTELSYTLIYPIEDITYEETFHFITVEEATRDLLSGGENTSQRDAMLFPWYPERLNLEGICDDWMEKCDDFAEEDRCKEQLASTTNDVAAISDDRIYQVYSESKDVSGFLTHPKFALTDDAEVADILWLYDHFKDFKSLAETPGKYVNQFPSENILTNKDLLAEVAMRSLKLDGHEVSNSELENRGPLWLPTTFNLWQELAQFVKCFKQREKSGLDNTWICKPWNLGRGLEHTVSNNLSQIIRLVETGPKVACKYIEDPVLFHREDVGHVKFDIRYMVALNSVQPLKLYAYKIFYTRFANVPYSLEDFEVYEKHMTVMNYRKGAELKQIHWDEFKVLFEQQHPNQSWNTLEDETFEIIRQLFKSAVSKPIPSGIGPNSQCRALYGLDFMYKWKDEAKTSVQPMLIEVNYCPSLKRCCKYQPHIINDFFDCMFFDKKGEHFVELS